MRTQEKNTSKKRRGLSRFLRGAGIALLAVALLLAGGLGFLSLTEYRPAPRETVEAVGTAEGGPAPGDSLSLLTWNIGYGALGDNADFFMDGGTMVNTANEVRLARNLDGILAELDAVRPDILFLQEIDRSSARSGRVDELARVRAALGGRVSSFANNFKVAFLPYPLPPIGKVDSGIATFTAFPVSGAERVQLPIPFSWPVRMVNLKRCALVSRVPLRGTDRELVLVNLHLDAYDSGEGKAAQTAALAALLQEEADKGNYVVAGGDFNQIFSSADTGAYPAQPGKWTSGEIDVSQFPDSWQFLMDAAVPSCRSLDRPYAGADRESFQYYLIDGFLVSSNVTVDSLATQDLGFVVSDHNPVLLHITLN